jgi:hypothetical protein
MYGNIVIGSGNSGNTAIGIEGYYSDGVSISGNWTSFWVSDLPLNIKMTIFKDTPAGIQLNQMIKYQKPVQEVSDFLFALALEYIGLDELKSLLPEALKAAYKEGYREGYSDKTIEIRKALGF